MSQTRTASATYTTTDVENVVRRVKADLTMIADSTGAWTAQQAADYAHDIEVLAKAGANLDPNARALLEEDLRSPCTEEIAVFHAFARTVEEGKDAFVVLDTAPTGHSLLLMDATGAYHRQALRQFEGSGEAVATIYLVAAGNMLAGAVPLVRIAISPPDMRLKSLSESTTTCAPDTPEREVAELFDKYNLLTLAVADEHGRLSGIITADDVISMLRND